MNNMTRHMLITTMFFAFLTNTFCQVYETVTTTSTIITPFQIQQ